MSVSKFLFALMLITVSAVVIVSLYISGSPITARAERFDTQRVNDLQSISYAIDSFWTNNQRLPNSLNDLKPTINYPNPPYYLQNISDPKTSLPYEFISDQAAGVISKYQLCATFELPNQSTDPKTRPYMPNDQLWQHTAGRNCFTLQVRTMNAVPVIK